MLALIDKLEQEDDVQKVFHTARLTASCDVTKRDGPRQEIVGAEEHLEADADAPARARAAGSSSSRGQVRLVRSSMTSQSREIRCR